MQSALIARREIHSLFADRRIRIATTVIALVPLLYGALYLWAFWDPYSRLDELPVALVNEDRPVETDGTTLSAGDDLADELLETGTLGWRSVSAAQAAQGIADGTYYMALTIPEGFSASLATANTTHPQAADLVVTAHESAGLLASQIGARVFSEVRAAASESASKTYLEHIFVAFADTGGRLKEAALGATDLAEGLDEASAGADSLSTGLASAHAGSRTLATGLAALADGASALADGAHTVDEGADALDSGLEGADAGAGRLSQGSATLASGASDLADGLSQASDGAADLDTGAQALAHGTASLDAGVQAALPLLQDAAAGAQSVHAGTSAVVAALRAYAASVPSATADPAFLQAMGAAQQTDAGAEDLAAGLVAAGPEFVKLAEGAHAVNVGASDLAQGAHLLATGVSAAADGSLRVAYGAAGVSSGALDLAAGIGRAADGASALSAGSADLSDGADAVKIGAGDAHDGSAALEDGLAQLDAGAAELSSGLAPAVSGSQELASGLTAGVAAIPDYDASTQEANAAMMSDPVHLTTERVDPVPNYGTGLSPYFIPLALWVGALMGFFVFRPLSAQAVREGRPAVIVALGSFIPSALFGIAQSTIMMLVLQFGLGLRPRSTLALYAFGALVAVTFVAIMQFLAGAFGFVGRFFAIVILMLQLTSSAGTFPLQTIPGFFQAINPYLPMTYVVGGLREVLSGGNWGVLGHDALALVVFAVAALACTSVTAMRARTWSPERLEPAMGI